MKRKNKIKTLGRERCANIEKLNIKNNHKIENILLQTPLNSDVNNGNTVLVIFKRPLEEAYLRKGQHVAVTGQRATIYVISASVAVTPSTLWSQVMITSRAHLCQLNIVRNLRSQKLCNLNSDLERVIHHKTWQL